MRAPCYVCRGICGANELTTDDAGKLTIGAGEETAQKIKAEENPWYLLATFYGVPGLRLLFRV